MALVKTLSVAFYGVDAHIIEVEANIGPGLPGTYIVGMATTGVTQSRDRIKTAAQNLKLGWPKSKVIVSLSPGDLRKTGSHLDAAIATSIIAAMHNNTAEKHRLATTLIIGELGLDGSIRAVPGVLPALLAAAQANIRTVIIPRANAAEAAIAPTEAVLMADNLADVVSWAAGNLQLESIKPQLVASKSGTTDFDMNQIAGQTEAKFAAEVAAAGGHNMFLIGPPGSGKSMLARRFPTIMPPLDHQAQIESTVVHSIAGLLNRDVITTPQVISPHHSVSKAALIGGGAGLPKPGAVSLAHNGILFLDEASEIPARTLDSLRGPLEQGVVRLQRADRSVSFPARFQLILAANPCRCAAELPADCRCSSTVRAQYLHNISGPLKDRIDIFTRTFSKGPLHCDENSDTSATIAHRVATARDRASRRWQRAGYEVRTNAAMRSSVLRRDYPADEVGMTMLESYLGLGKLTQRGVDRTLKLAWTLADLAGIDRPGLEQVAVAMDLREEAE